MQHDFLLMQFLLGFTLCSSTYSPRSDLLLQCKMHSCGPASSYGLESSRNKLRRIHGGMQVEISAEASPWTTYSSGKLYIALHDSDAFGVYSTEICVFKQMDEESLGGLLQCQYGRALPAQTSVTHLIVSVRHHIQRDLANDARKGESAEEEVGTTLILANLAEGEGAGSVTPFLALAGLLVCIRV